MILDSSELNLESNIDCRYRPNQRSCSKVLCTIAKDRTYDTCATKPIVCPTIEIIGPIESTTLTISAKYEFRSS